MLIMFAVQPVIAAAIVLPLVSVVVVTQLATTRIRAHRAAYRRRSAAVTGLLGELFGAVLAVKSAHAGEGIVRHLADLNEHRRRAGLKDQLITQLLGKFNRATVDLSVGVVLLLAVPAMGRGDFTVGDLALFVSYAASLVWVPHYAGQLLARHRQAGVSIERLTALLPAASPGWLPIARSRARSRGTRRSHRRRTGTPHRVRAERRPPGLRARCARPRPGRRARHVHRRHRPGRRRQDHAAPGRPRTAARQQGTVRWNDRLVEDRRASCATTLGVRPAGATTVQRVAAGQPAARPPGRPACSRRCTRRSSIATSRSMPAGLDTRVGARGVRLSGGQVQRAAIARALVRRPDLLVLDDVSSALDVGTERRLWDRLLADPDRTLLVVSNRPATIARADRSSLHHGQIQDSRTSICYQTDTGGDPCRFLQSSSPTAPA